VLTPSRIASIEPQIRQFAQEVVDGFKGKGEFDASPDYSQMIPTITMCTLMDLPREMREQFLKWNLDTIGGADFTSQAAQRSWAEMAEYWTSVVVDRRQHKGDDLISEILHAQIDGEDLSDEEVSGFCSLLHDASQNTTMNMICNAIISLGRFPDQRRKLAEDPTLWPRAMEELLRYESPVQGLARATTVDVTMGDTVIPAGDQVLLLYGSANHDETVYERPDVLDFDRVVKTHWTFGHGIHYCLGNAVARLETRVALQVMLETIKDWEVDEAAVERIQLVPTRGVAHAPVTFDPVTS
jgi:cytochrome P450